MGHDDLRTGMGLKHRIHPLAASMALGQLRRLDEYLEGRAQIARYLIEELRGIPASRCRNSTGHCARPGTA